jgi:hypothetical protein
MAVGASIRRHLRSNVVGYVALFIALSAGAYAAGLPRNSVKSKQIKDGQVRLNDLAVGSVDGSKVIDDSLSAADIQDGAGSGLGADQLDGVSSNGFLQTGTAAGGDLSGTFSALQIGANAVGATEVAGGSLPAGDLSFDPATQAELDDFRIRTDHASENVSGCVDRFNDPPGDGDGECATITFTVPAGRTALASIWSTFTAFGGAAESTLFFCPSIRAQAAAPTCRSPFGAESALTVPPGKWASGATSGETLPLAPGTYVAGTKISDNGPGAVETNSGQFAITKILVRDAVTAAP